MAGLLLHTGLRKCTRLHRDRDAVAFWGGLGRESLPLHQEKKTRQELGSEEKKGIRFVTQIKRRLIFVPCTCMHIYNVQ